MSRNQGYDVVVDIDDSEVSAHCIPFFIYASGKAHIRQGDLGHTDLQPDLEFHSSSKSLTSHFSFIAMRFSKYSYSMQSKKKIPFIERLLT
jgi:hypothetical protein